MDFDSDGVFKTVLALPAIVQNSSSSIGTSESPITITDVKESEDNARNTILQKTSIEKLKQADHVVSSKETDHDSGEESQNLSFSDEEIVIDCENLESEEYYEV